MDSLSLLFGLGFTLVAGANLGSAMAIRFRSKREPFVHVLAAVACFLLATPHIVSGLTERVEYALVALGVILFAVSLLFRNRQASAA